MKCVVHQLVKREKDHSFSTQYSAHTWTDDRLILYTEKGEILLVGAKEGDFKMLLPESPVSSFSIRYAVNSFPNGFIVADNAGRYLVFELMNDPKSPYKMVKSLVSACLLILYSRPPMTSMKTGQNTCSRWSSLLTSRLPA